MSYVRMYLGTCVQGPTLVHWNPLYASCEASNSSIILAHSSLASYQNKAQYTDSDAVQHTANVCTSEINSVQYNIILHGGDFHISFL